jgi:Zn-finger nucleic acid-binding protein
MSEGMPPGTAQHQERPQEEPKLSLRCPHCASSLVASRVEDTQVFSCPERHGLLIPQKTFASIVTKSWRAIPRDYAEQATFPPRQDRGADIACPACGVAMARHPYCGIKGIEIDSCPTCRRLWLDADELEAALAAVAKMNYRSTQREATHRRVRLKPGQGMDGSILTPWLFLSPDLAVLQAVRRMDRDGQCKGPFVGIAALVGLLLGR